MMKTGASIVIAVAPLLLAATQPTARWSYSYPPQARAIPALKAWMDRQAAATRARVEADAAAERRTRKASDLAFPHFDSDRTWKVVTDTPRFLSLSLETYKFTGGAHGNTHFGSLIWDRARAVRMGAAQFFFSPAALKAAIEQPFCRELNRQREAKRGEPVGPSAGDGFTDCIDPTGETLILGSTDRRRFNRIGVLIAPYEAGPYSEGSYEVTLPVTPAVLAAVRPEWRPYFATGTP